MRLVVVVPTYNEKDNITDVIKRVLDQGKKIKNIDLQVLVSDSHSPDGTAQIVKRISKNSKKVHYLDVKKRGLGIGIVEGHRFAITRLKADILAQMDGDLSHDPSSIVEMLNEIKKGYDLVIGSRLMKGGKNLLGWHRRLFTRGSALFCKISWGTFGISEYTNSYRVFTKELFEKIDFKKIPWHSKTYIIQPSFLYGAIAAGAKIKEVPITFQDRKKGYSKAQIIAYTFDVIKFGLKVRFQKSKTLIKFLMVGSVSYLINAFLLGILNRGDLFFFPILNKPLLSIIPTEDFAPLLLFVHLDRLLISSIISIQASIIFNFIFHDNWTFKYRSREGPKLRRFLKFNLTSFGSPFIQLASILFFARVFNLHEQIGLAIGVAIGLFFNYCVNMLWIWKAPQSSSNKPVSINTA